MGLHNDKQDCGPRFGNWRCGKREEQSDSWPIFESVLDGSIQGLFGADCNVHCKWSTMDIATI